MDVAVRVIPASIFAALYGIVCVTLLVFVNMI